MKQRAVRTTFKRVFPLATIVLFLYMGAGQLFVSPKADAAELTSRSLELSTNAIAATDVTYNLSFTVATPGTVGSIEIQFCSNSTFVTDPCDVPFGIDATNAVLKSQSGATGFTIGTVTDDNQIVLTRPSVVVGAVPVNYVFTNIINPSDAGPVYVRLQTFASSDASGPATDSGGIALDFLSSNEAVGVSTTVPPFLTLCVATAIPTYALDCSSDDGDYVDVGNITAGSTSTGTSQVVATTNAGGGYSLYVQGDTLTSGNNVIPALASPASSQPGTGQFGINLRANTNPAIGSDPAGPGYGEPVGNYAIPNEYTFNSGDEIATSAHADDYRRYTISYIVNINKSQPVGVYAGTYTYIGLANF